MTVETQIAQTERAGQFVPQAEGSDGYSAFLPRPLPPDPPLRIDPELQELLDQANQALGRLDGITLLLPDPDHFLFAYIRKEAVLSSQIEGTQSSLSDLLLYEHNAAPRVPLGDVKEASNYIAATNHGIGEMAAGRPLCLNLLKEVHERLLRRGRGGSTGPGEFRRIQNRIGGDGLADARFVPPPPQEVPGAMSDLEKFLHDQPTPTPILLKAALAHAQFETIHPFLDGNGRVGRLLITLLLCADPAPPHTKVLSRPLLYLSLYLKRNRDTYYERLQRIRTEGAWEDWVRFFLRGVIEVAGLATETTRRIIHLIEEDRKRIHTLGRAAGSAQLVHDLLAREVIITIPFADQELHLSEPTISTAITNLESLGITRELTGRPRNRIFAYDQYLSILNEGTEPT